MSEKPTYASVTGEPCSCGWLEHRAADPDVPLVFDRRTGEYQFTYSEPGSTGPSTLILYHCPFCGGAAPPSQRHLLFATIPRAEQDRLAELLDPIATLAEAVKRLGRPSWEGNSFDHTPEGDAQPPVTSARREYRYEQLSEVAVVRLFERADGSIGWELWGKPKDQPAS